MPLRQKELKNRDQIKSISITHPWNLDQNPTSNFERESHASNVCGDSDEQYGTIQERRQKWSNFGEWFFIVFGSLKVKFFSKFKFQIISAPHSHATRWSGGRCRSRAACVAKESAWVCTRLCHYGKRVFCFSKDLFQRNVFEKAILYWRDFIDHNCFYNWFCQFLSWFTAEIMACILSICFIRISDQFQVHFFFN